MRLFDEDDLEQESLQDDAGLDMEAIVFCPHCAASVEMILDPGGGSVQESVEDCEVCCQPWSVRVTYDREGQAQVTLTTLDE